MNARGWKRKSWFTRAGVRRTGTRFSKVYLQRMLINPLYIGQVRLHDEVYPGLHEAIVDEETFREVGALLVANRNYGDMVTRNKNGTILRRLVKCGRCGAAMAYCWTRKPGGRIYSYLRCCSEQKQGREACPTPTLSAPEVEAAIVSEIRRLAQDPCLVDQVFPEVSEQAKQGRQQLESQRTRLLRQREQREEAIKRLVATLESPTGELPEVVGERIKEHQTEVQRLNDRLQTVEQELAALDSLTINREHLTQTLVQFTDLWDALYPMERVKLVHSLIESVVYHDETDHLEFHFKTSGGDVT